MTARDLDRAIEALARRQHGAFNRTQARALGASTSAIDRRLASGAWLRLAPSVYALPSNPPTFERQCMAATLAEPVGWICGSSAAVLHAFPDARAGRIQLTVPLTASHRGGLAVIRRASQFDATRVANIPVGTIEQTVCDLARTMVTSEVEALVDSLASTRRTTIADIACRFERLPPGAQRALPSLRAVLADRDPGAYVPPSTVLEAALYRVLGDPRLEPCIRQPAFPWRSDGARADALIPAWRLFVEADGRAWHTRAADFERDRQRDRDAMAHGYDTVRFTYDELIHAPDRVIDELLAIGTARSRRGA